METGRRQTAPEGSTIREDRPNFDDKLITSRHVRELCGNVSDMTIWRWERDPTLGFPKPIKINGRNYRRLGDLRRWIATRGEAA